MKSKRALIVGATGAVGKELLEILLINETWQKIKVIARKPSSISHPRLDWIVAEDFFSPSLKDHFEGITHLFICIGTTKAKTPNKEVYRKIDLEIPSQMAAWASESDVYHILVVSSIGAKASSKVFYLKTKGEMENAIKQNDIPRVDFFRPSTIIGDRPEYRPGEALGIALDRIFRLLIPKKYRSIHARQLAQKMEQIAQLTQEGVYYHYNDTLLD